MSADTHDIIHTHGREYGSDTGLYLFAQSEGPVHLAVDDNEFVFVANLYKQRVTLLSPTLNYIRQVVSRDKLKWRLDRLHLDVQRRRLYVADNEWKDGEDTAGCVVVFSVWRAVFIADHLYEHSLLLSVWRCCVTWQTKMAAMPST